MIDVNLLLSRSASNLGDVVDALPLTPGPPHPSGPPPPGVRDRVEGRDVRFRPALPHHQLAAGPGTPTGPGRWRRTGRPCMGSSPLLGMSAMEEPAMND